VTNEEIVEGEKLIADMRHVLSVLRGTADAEKLVLLARDKWSPWMRSLTKLYQLGVVSHDDIMTLRMDTVWGAAVESERRPDLKSKLTEFVTKEARRVDCILNQTAESLRSSPKPDRRPDTKDDDWGDY
jgi:hypothetical protein